jgi:hypothetical protein
VVDRVQCRSLDRWNIQIEAWQPVAYAIGARWDVQFIHPFVSVQTVQVNIEAPQPMQVAEHLFGGFA